MRSSFIARGQYTHIEVYLSLRFLPFQHSILLRYFKWYLVCFCSIPTIVSEVIMATRLNNSTGSIRVQVLHDRLVQLNKRRRSLEKRDEELQMKSRQLQEMAKKALSISLTDRSGEMVMESPAKRPRLDTSFQRGSVARRMVRRVSVSRLQKASVPVPPEISPISRQTSSSLLQMSAVMSVSPVHELKTFIIDGVQHTPCWVQPINESCWCCTHTYSLHLYTVGVHFSQCK